MPPTTYRYQGSWDVSAALLEPLDVQVSGDGRLVVADGRRNVVRVYDASGNILQWWDRAGGVALCDPLVPFAVTIDLSSHRLFVGWHCYVEGRLSPRGFYLETRDFDAETAPAMPLVPVIGATDMVYREANGMVYVLGARGIYLVDPVKAQITGQIEVPTLGGFARRMAVTPDGTVAIVRAADTRITLFAPSGEVSTIPLEDLRPVAIAADPEGLLHALVRPNVGFPGRGPTPLPASDALLLTFAPDGTLLNTSDSTPLGVPQPPAGDWPWAIAASGAGLALTTALDRFEVHTFRADLSGHRRLLGGLQTSAFHPRAWATRTGLEPFGVDAGPGGIRVLDGLDGVVVSLDPAGDSISLTEAVAGTQDVAVLADGATILASEEAVSRLPDAESRGAWRLPCRCEFGGRLATSGQAVYLTRPASAEVAVLGARTGVELGRFAQAAAGLWPSDVAAWGDAVFTADLATGAVRPWRAEVGGDAWSAMLGSGPNRLAAGPGPAGPVLAVLTADGSVQVHQVDDSRLAAQWRPTRPDGGPLAAWDIAVTADAAILLADGEARAIHVFRPDEAPPPPSPTVAPQATPAVPVCRMTGTKTALPARVRVGQPVTVTLSLQADCPPGAYGGLDVVLAVDRSSSMQGANLEAAQLAARRFVERLDLGRHRVGLVAFSDDAVVANPLSNDAAAVLRALRGLSASGGTNISAALERSAGALAARGRPGARQVIVLLTDGNHTGGTRSPRDVAAELRGRGITIFVIGTGGLTRDSARLLAEIAGDVAHYLYAQVPSDLGPAYQAVLAALLSPLPGQLVVEDQLAAGMALESDSVSPPPVLGIDRLWWARPELPSEAVSFSYRARPIATGPQPVNVAAFASYVDVDGVPRRFEFPIPTIEAFEDLATPDSTPTPTAGPRVHRAYLPVLERGRCHPGPHFADIVLVMDGSSSMAEPIGAAGSKAALAASAALRFLEQLRWPGDRVAVVSFADDARRLIPLSSDAGLVRLAILSIAPGGASRMDLGIRDAAAALDQTAAGRQRVMIVLSDGRVGPVPPDVVVTEAARAKAQGIRVFAVGFGDAVDVVTMRRVASGNDFYWALDGGHLDAIYVDVARRLPCPASQPMASHPATERISPTRTVDDLNRNVTS